MMAYMAWHVRNDIVRIAVGKLTQWQCVAVFYQIRLPIFIIFALLFCDTMTSFLKIRLKPLPKLPSKKRAFVEEATALSL